VDREPDQKVGSGLLSQAVQRGDHVGGLGPLAVVGVDEGEVLGEVLGSDRGRFWGRFWGRGRFWGQTEF
jgi:hypothetical protein